MKLDEAKNKVWNKKRQKLSGQGDNVNTTLNYIDIQAMNILRFFTFL